MSPYISNISYKIPLSRKKECKQNGELFTKSEQIWDKFCFSDEFFTMKSCLSGVSQSSVIGDI